MTKIVTDLLGGKRHRVKKELECKKMNIVDQNVQCQKKKAEKNIATKILGDNFFFLQ